MKTLFFASALTLGALWFTVPAGASVTPLPAPSSSFTSGSLHVDLYGSAGKQALVFIPGLTCGPWEWSGEIARFANTYTIYALTLPGFDGAAPVQGPLFKTVSADFWTMLSAHNIVKPIIVGHSLGGTLAIMLAEQHSDLIRGVIAVDGLPVFPGTENLSAAQRTAAAAHFGSMLSSVSTPQQFEYAEQTYSLPYMIKTKADIPAVAHLSAKSDPKASGAWATEDLMLDLRPQLKDVRVPLLEIGPYDQTLEGKNFPDAAKKQAYYATLLSGDQTAKVQIVQDSLHFIMYDQPAELDAAITAFLQGA